MSIEAKLDAITAKIDAITVADNTVVLAAIAALDAKVTDLATVVGTETPPTA